MQKIVQVTKYVYNRTISYAVGKNAERISEVDGPRHAVVVIHDDQTETYVFEPDEICYSPWVAPKEDEKWTT